MMECLVICSPVHHPERSLISTSPLVSANKCAHDERLAHANTRRLLGSRKVWA